LLLHVAVKSFCLVERIVMGKNGVGMFRRQSFTVIRRARLKDNRTPCGVRPIFSGPATWKKSPW
jgi:hypothetical protein